jgi:hypothetical protein
VSDPAPASPVNRLRQLLAAKANRAGGWGYYFEKSSRIEPTCWALLALAETWDREAAEWNRFAAPHLQFLGSTQRPDGLLVDVPHGPPNFTANGLAACVLVQLGTASRPSPTNEVGRPSPTNEVGRPSPTNEVSGLSPADVGRVLDGVIGVKGISVDLADPRQDNRLQGWPWMPETFSWVEPTSWCVLALKKARSWARSGAEPRIAEADKLILNRSCEAGGWNFGNASVFGQDLRAYVPTTAQALIALQDRRTEPVVERSLAYLNQARVKEPSAMALALTALCLRIYDLSAGDVEERLAADVDRAERTGNLQALAMMLYALTVNKHNAAALRI